MANGTLISDALAKALSGQVGEEYRASIQYVMIAAYFKRQALPNLAGMFQRQAAEEAAHSQKIMDYITNAGGVVQIPAIPQGKSDFASVEEAVQLALDSEIEVAKMFNGHMELAIAEHDHLARGFLQWFVDEQLEEVSTMDDLLKVVRRAANNLLYVEEYVAGQPAPHAGTA